MTESYQELAKDKTIIPSYGMIDYILSGDTFSFFVMKGQFEIITQFCGLNLIRWNISKMWIKFGGVYRSWNSIIIVNSHRCHKSSVEDKSCGQNFIWILSFSSIIK